MADCSLVALAKLDALLLPVSAPKVPKREGAGVVGTSPLNASGGSITVEGRNDGLGTLGVLAGVWAGVLAGVL